MFTYIFNVPVPVHLGTEELCKRWFQDRARGLMNTSQCGCEGQGFTHRAWPFPLSGKRYGWSCPLSKNSNEKSSAVAVRFVIWL